MEMSMPGSALIRPPTFLSLGLCTIVFLNAIGRLMKATGTLSRPDIESSSNLSLELAELQANLPVCAPLSGCPTMTDFARLLVELYANNTA
ncbi:hypothetical protein PM082_006249 [Marasmius tenuissimus]|nr:hypothetical protein PM082_006249 [Marasmius tenuissimus]